MINLDPSIINQDDVRKKRRKKLLLMTTAPVIITFAAALFFLRPGVFDIIFSILFNSENAGGAITLSQVHKNANIIEPYIAYYDAGTAYLKNGEGKKAEEELRESIKYQPPTDKICQVSVNLSYSIEIQADEAKILKKYDNALVLYSRAEGVLYENGCANKDDRQNDKDKKAAVAKKRISQKRGLVVSEMNNSGNPSDIDQDKGGLEISEEQLKKMMGDTINGNVIRNEVLDRLGRYGSNSGASGYYTYHW